MATRKQQAQPPLTAKQFAVRMGINYRTALNWLEQGIVPGAEWRETPLMSYWEIPASALSMELPKRPGPKPRPQKEEEAA